MSLWNVRYERSGPGNPVLSSPLKRGITPSGPPCWRTTPSAPAAVLVYGHSVTTLAAALAAAEHGIPVIHVGAGQLPRDMNCPEGRHAGLTDRLSSLLCCLDPADEQRLHAELMERGSCVTGDTLYDLFEMDRPRLRPFEEAERHGMAAGTFILCYLRHPATLRSLSAGASCWKACRHCTPGRASPSCWYSIRPPFPVSRILAGNSRLVSASCPP